MNKKEKSENRKAFPKFLGVMLISALVGGLIGGLLGFFSGTSVTENVAQTIYAFFITVAPHAIWTVTLVLTAAELLLYWKAKAMFESWDGENEDHMDQTEERLSWVLLLSGINMILVFFFFTLVQMAESAAGPILILVQFVIALAVIAFVQQKTVDLTRKMNPEKKGSVYDMKFQKKWFESCDENERRQIGIAAMKAYNVANYACIGVWLGLTLLAMVYPVGILPPLAVTIIWLAVHVAYCIEAIRLGRHKA